MKKKIIMGVSLIVMFGLGVVVGTIYWKNQFGILDKCADEQCNKDINAQDYYDVENVVIKHNRGSEYYVATGSYDGEYDYQKIDLSEYYNDLDKSMDMIKLYNTSDILSYDQYSRFCQKWNLKQKYTVSSSNKNFMVISYASYGGSKVDAGVANALIKDGNINVYVWDEFEFDETSSIAGYFIVIPVDFTVTQSKVKPVLSESEYDKIINDPEMIVGVAKPIMYFYPKKETEINVEFDNSNLFTVSYPKYNNGWNVVAQPDGNLKDLKTGRNYYGLYYEANGNDAFIKDDGFVVKGEDTIKFLGDKLSILGLNERESNEFIIYWLPKLEKNKYNYIRFETMEEINEYMPVRISPTPDSIIRVIMNYKPLKKKISVKEQKLEEKKRFGFSVIEWGGSEIK